MTHVPRTYAPRSSDVICTNMLCVRYFIGPQFIDTVSNYRKDLCQNCIIYELHKKYTEFKISLSIDGMVLLYYNGYIIF